jgi:hypothetical protein
VPTLLPPVYKQRHGQAEWVELARDRPLRSRNKLHYRFAHWPVWIFVVFIAPGPLTFNLFAHGPEVSTWLWLAAATTITGVIGLLGRLPGTEATPYILRYNEDGPNPLHRRIFYTLAWTEIVIFAVLNSAGLIDALLFGRWRLRAIYDVAYGPLAIVCALIGLAGWWPRARPSVRGERYERRWFYGAVWAVATAQPLLWLLWKVLPQQPAADTLKLAAFWGVLVLVADLARRGVLPRTRPILPGESVVVD